MDVNASGPSLPTVICTTECVLLLSLLVIVKASKNANFIPNSTTTQQSHVQSETCLVLIQTS